MSRTEKYQGQRERSRDRMRRTRQVKRTLVGVLVERRSKRRRRRVGGGGGDGDTSRDYVC